MPSTWPGVEPAIEGPHRRPALYQLANQVDSPLYILIIAHNRIRVLRSVSVSQVAEKSVDVKPTYCFQGWGNMIIFADIAYKTYTQIMNTLKFRFVGVGKAGTNELETGTAEESADLPIPPEECNNGLKKIHSRWSRELVCFNASLIRSKRITDRRCMGPVPTQGATIGSEIPLRKSYNGWGAHGANHTIPPFWLDDRPPLFGHVAMKPAAGLSILALRGL
ncbi:hypothetical protein ANN_03457 [Periplaneta americana]|uniref:Uncharacterized protein n=1 Tax=Periplaneta americana TaxID=6978 RepID=A0ABQ8U083_PERAM|nr:hypothetical protein ANN_03457 [Periplaneta americana]